MNRKRAGRGYSSGNDGKLNSASIDSQPVNEIRHRLISTLDDRKDIRLGNNLGIGRRASVLLCVPLIHLAIPPTAEVTRSRLVRAINPCPFVATD